MVYRNFEIRQYTDFNPSNKLKYELIKWYEHDGKRYCYTVAFIEWDEDEPCWEFRSVGMRFIEDYEEGLCEYIKAYMNLVDVVREANVEEDNI